jgi:tRNA(Ile)-lysidine synthase
MEQIINRVMDYIELHEMIGKNDRILLSMSAGKDSMFLFTAFSILKNIFPFEIGVFHLNHMVRGEDADADERHVISVAESHGIEIMVEKYNFNESGVHGVSFEEHARDVRYGLLNEMAVRKGYNKIATAHTKDDTIETVLMRMFTGTGIHGLRGIPPKRGMIIRPLLSLAVSEIYDFLTANRIPWREDKTNIDTVYSRNFIRNELLPLVRTRFPMIDSAISSLSNVASESMLLLDELLNEKFAGLIERHDDHVCIDVNCVLHNRPAFNHIVAAILRDDFGQNVNRHMLHQLHTGFGTGKANASLFANNSIKAEKIYYQQKNLLKLSRITEEGDFQKEWEKRIDLTGVPEQFIHLNDVGISVQIKVCDVESYQNFTKNDHSVFVTLENNVNTIYIRNRRKGDRIRTECGTKKLKDFFIEKKLSRSEKNRVPILVIGSTIAAIMPGLLSETSNRVSSDFLVDKKSKKVLSVSAYSKDR